MAEIKKRKPKLTPRTYKTLPWNKTKEYLLSNGLMTNDDFRDLDYTLYKDIDFQACELILVPVEDKIEMWAEADRANNKFVKSIIESYSSELKLGDIILFTVDE